MRYKVKTFLIILGILLPALLFPSTRSFAQLGTDTLSPRLFLQTATVLDCETVFGSQKEDIKLRLGPYLAKCKSQLLLLPPLSEVSSMSLDYLRSLFSKKERSQMCKEARAQHGETLKERIKELKEKHRKKSPLNWRRMSAGELGISLALLRYYLKKYGLEDKKTQVEKTGNSQSDTGRQPDERMLSTDERALVQKIETFLRDIMEKTEGYVVNPISAEEELLEVGKCIYVIHESIRSFQKDDLSMLTENLTALKYYKNLLIGLMKKIANLNRNDAERVSNRLIELRKMIEDHQQLRKMIPGSVEQENQQNNGLPDLTESSI